MVPGGRRRPMAEEQQVANSELFPSLLSGLTLRNDFDGLCNNDMLSHKLVWFSGMLH